MTGLRLDYCAHCACVTTLHGYTPEQAVADLDAGRLGCWYCLEAQQDGDPDGHTRCVALMDVDDHVLWDGRHKTP